MLQLLIDLAYQVPIHERVGLHNVRAVLDVAEALDISMVRDHCLQLLGKNLEPENCVVTYQVALNRGYRMLCSDAFRYMVRNFDKVWATNSEFQSLTPDQLVSVLHDDELHTPNEVECTFGAVLKWIAGNVEERRGHLPRLLPLIRFAFCSRADIEKVERDPLVRTSEQAREVLFIVKRTLNQEPVNNLYWRSRPDLSERCWLKPRVPKDLLFMFGGWTGGATNHLLTYNCRSGSWLLQPDQDTGRRAYHGVAMLDGLIYFVGGFDGYRCYHTVVTLDVSRRKWASRSNMQVARCYVSVAVLQGYIYAMGGFDGEDRTSSCERYDANRNQWGLVASMHSVRSDACAAAAAGRIYIMGGYTGREVLDSVECYDPSVDAWSYVRSMSSPRSGLKAVVHDDIIYVLGGFNGATRLETAERMDARRGHWSELPSMTFPRSNFVAVLLAGSIYAAGGFDGATTVSLVERYDIQTRQWHSAPGLGIACSAAAACVYQDIPKPRLWL
ncbi:hypothetical protein HPB48_001208 [Haemaphysalis longicornis]|uniref:BACK domain-containing protein n=1 Tax=Haemaphysalis longicornis TaxID=44386 RepID=A0A9J6FIQ0_HAELO|nr:hypothetical protein HPB48_001208 [Haemaphysalis longicornis]